MSTERKAEWFDDDEFWEVFAPHMFPEERFEESHAQMELVLALTKPPGKKVLDLCCGPGRCALALAKAGYEVTGVDLTKSLLEDARRRAKEAGLAIEWVEADMRDFVRPESFDLVINMYTSFGYFDDQEEDVQVLGNILESLKPGGACLIEVMGKEVLAKVFQPAYAETLPDGSTFIQRREVTDDWTWIQNEWILIRDSKARSFKIGHTLYSGQELRERMEKAGFAEVRLFGSIDGDHYDRNARRLIAVGRKS